MPSPKASSPEHVHALPPEAPFQEDTKLEVEAGSAPTSRAIERPARVLASLGPGHEWSRDRSPLSARSRGPSPLTSPHDWPRDPEGPLASPPAALPSLLGNLVLKGLQLNVLLGSLPAFRPFARTKPEPSEGDGGGDGHLAARHDAGTSPPLPLGTLRGGPAHGDGGGRGGGAVAVLPQAATLSAPSFLRWEGLMEMLRPPGGAPREPSDGAGRSVARTATRSVANSAARWPCPFAR